MSIAITEAITTLAEAEQQFNLSPTEEETFFLEWQENLSEISITEKAALDQLHWRYLYQRSAMKLLEGIVMLLLISPLLAIAGFYDPPFKVKA